MNYSESEENSVKVMSIYPIIQDASSAQNVNELDSDSVLNLP